MRDDGDNTPGALVDLGPVLDHLGEGRTVRTERDEPLGDLRRADLEYRRQRRGSQHSVHSARTAGEEDGHGRALREELGESLRAVRVMCKSIEAGVRATSQEGSLPASSRDVEGPLGSDPRVWRGGYNL